MYSIPNILCVGPNAFDGHIDPADGVVGSRNDAKGTTAHDSSLIKVIPHIYSECVACDFERLNEWIHRTTEEWIGVHIQLMSDLYKLFAPLYMMSFETICVSMNSSAPFLVIHLVHDTPSRRNQILSVFRASGRATVFPAPLSSPTVSHSPKCVAWWLLLYGAYTPIRSSFLCVLLRHCY